MEPQTYNEKMQTRQVWLHGVLHKGQNVGAVQPIVATLSKEAIEHCRQHKRQGSKWLMYWFSESL
jgi:hypothetical protein